jgi:hypothetical protein
MTRWLLGLVIVAACSKKDNSADVAALADLKTKLAAYEGCLTGNQAGDFTGALVTTLSAAIGGLDCAESTRTPVVDAVHTLAHRVAVEFPDLEMVAFFAGVRDADKACSDLERLGDVATAIAKHIDGSTITVPKCELAKVTVAPIELPEQFTEKRAELQIQDGALIAFGSPEYHALDEKGALARTVDGKAWDVRETPSDLHEWTWPASGPVGITWADKHPRTILVDDGKNGWKRAAQSPIDGVYSIWSNGPQVAIVGFEKGRDDTMVVRHSIDHGATVGPPITLLAGKDVDVRARVRPDGTVVALGGRSTGQLEAVRLAPGAKTATHTASLSGGDAGDSDNEARMCGAGDVYWGMHRSLLVMSTDAGQSWHAIGDVGGELRFAHLECTATLLLVWSQSEKGYELRSCSAKGCAAPLAVPGPLTIGSRVGFELEPVPQLLISREWSLSGDPSVVEVIKIEPAGFTRTRVMIVKGASAVREGGSFVVLQSVQDL